MSILWGKIEAPGLSPSQSEGKIIGLFSDQKRGQDQLNVLHELNELIELIGLYRDFQNSIIKLVLCFFESPNIICYQPHSSSTFSGHLTFFIIRVAYSRTFSLHHCLCT